MYVGHVIEAWVDRYLDKAEESRRRAGPTPARLIQSGIRFGGDLLARVRQAPAMLALEQIAR